MSHNLKTSLKLALGAASLVAASVVAPTTSYADANYDLVPAVVGECHAGAECTVTLTATTKGEFHVNESYPFKLTLAGAGVEFHGSAGATFTGGDFARNGKTVGVMTIKSSSSRRPRAPSPSPGSTRSASARTRSARRARSTSRSPSR
jgi:hypothetical protein